MRANGGPQVWSLTQFLKHNWGPTTSVWAGMLLFITRLNPALYVFTGTGH